MYRIFLFSLIILTQFCTISPAIDLGELNLNYSAKGPLIQMIHLDGFEISSYWDEQIKTYMFDTDVRIHINASSSDKFLNTLPIHLVFYTLPNGNSIQWTIGKQTTEGDDWHYDIQHIGAQTRKLREMITDENIVVAYLEANPKSWPNYRQRHSDSGELINRILDSVIKQMPYKPAKITLSGHSGGGSFSFGFINSHQKIPDWINRLSFLDSLYAYDDQGDHYDKFMQWLKKDKNHYLSIISYDDREIEWDGKKVVGPTGGTYRRTHEIIARFQKDIPLSCTTIGEYIRWTGLNGRVDIIIHPNPGNKILHTVLVEKNGYIHSLTSGTPYENQIGRFWQSRVYDEWIEKD